MDCIYIALVLCHIDHSKHFTMKSTFILSLTHSYIVLYHIPTIHAYWHHTQSILFKDTGGSSRFVLLSERHPIQMTHSVTLQCECPNKPAHQQTCTWTIRSNGFPLPHLFIVGEPVRSLVCCTLIFTVACQRSCVFDFCFHTGSVKGEVQFFTTWTSWQKRNWLFWWYVDPFKRCAYP